MLRLNQIRAYQLASTLSDRIWRLVQKWPLIAQKTIGNQLIRSVDSIAANIAEGEGRHFKKDKIKFYYQARGSLYESAHWIEKAKERTLISKIAYDQIIEVLRQIPKQIRFLIANASLKLKR